jgi:hypothetical protein
MPAASTAGEPFGIKDILHYSAKQILERIPVRKELSRHTKTPPGKAAFYPNVIAESAHVYSKDVDFCNNQDAFQWMLSVLMPIHTDGSSRGRFTQQPLFGNCMGSSWIGDVSRRPGGELLTQPTCSRHVLSFLPQN